MILTVPRDETLYPTLGPQVCDFIEQNLVFGPGDLRGKPAVVDEETAALIYRFYEVYPRGHRLAGRRRFPRCAISLSKGTAKTEKAAWITACELHPDAPVRFTGWTASGEPIGGPVTDPYIALVAYTEEQSDDLAYTALKVIIEEGPLKHDFDVGLDRIKRLKGDGIAQSLSGSPSARDGARTTFQHFDEPLALDTLVPTPDGWKTIGDLDAGDFVYGREGRALRVMGASPVHVDRACYRVTFEDGDSVVTDGSHRWKAIEWSNRPAGETVVTTVEMWLSGVTTKYGYRWRLPRSNGFDGTAHALPIDPYVLGLWLGDGATDAGYIHSAAGEYAALAAGIQHTVSRDARLDVVRWLPTGLRSKLRAVGALGRKHIPTAYLFASRDQRLELLRGLMDSDGHTTIGGSCAFVQKQRELCEEVAFLVRSLGAAASVTVQREPRSRTGVVCKVHFSPAFRPFRLERKASRFSWQPRRCTTWPAIVAIEPVASVPVRCIAVEGDDNLFLVGRGLHLTHNTHRFTLQRLLDAFKTMVANTAKRRNAWSLETTTAFEPGSGSVAELTMQYAQAVADGLIEDAGLFYFHRQAGDEHDLSTLEGFRAAVIEALGPTAAWRDIDTIVALRKDPTADHAYQDRVYCNRLVKGSTQAFDVIAWKKLEQPENPCKPGDPIALGFDGAQFHDGTGLVATHIETGYQWVCGLWECPPDGEKRTPPWQVPAHEVDALVHRLFAEFNVWRLYADPPYWQSWIAKWIGELGKDRVIEWWTNRRKPMTAALENYDTAIKEGRLSHDGDKRLQRHLGNSRRLDLGQRDEQGKALWLIQKERPDSPQKIDLAMCGCVSWECRTDAIAAGILKAPPPPQLFFLGAGAPAKGR